MTMILIYLRRAQVLLLVLKRLILKLLPVITFLQNTNVSALIKKDVEEETKRNLRDRVDPERILDHNVYPRHRETSV